MIELIKEKTMNIFINEEKQIFHLQNDKISYICGVMPGGYLGQFYFGKRLHESDDFSWLFENDRRGGHTACTGDDDAEGSICLELVKQEYPVYGSGDYRQGAVEVLQENGSRVTDFTYDSAEIVKGKPELEKLPATYTEKDDEAMTLIVHLSDKLLGLKLDLLYTIFAQDGIIARSAKITNEGSQSVHVTRAMSLSLDLPDHNYEWVQFSGAWARERHAVARKLEIGITAVESMRGNSSLHQNPFVILKRPNADENSGEAMGFSLIYSGNFLAQAQVDTYDMTRLMIGIHPQNFSWKLESGESFQTPEAVIAFSAEGTNGMSQSLHRLFRSRLARGVWRDKARPILINNWEATYFDITEEKVLRIASKAKECGVELFVLDDGWFGARRDDRAGLGDWTPCKDVLENGISGLSEKIHALGMMFGLWFEPEMVNANSDLYREHPDWVMQAPGRRNSLSRHQMVLDFSRKEVVDNLYEQMVKVLDEAKLDYIKWDMNRSITECWSAALPADRQGEVFHRYILGVYDLYDRLTKRYPNILFESCSSGGGRFDPGMLYYAPQAWTSDDTDAVERLKIQYGSSYAYPVSSWGAHVSAVPNHQVGRLTTLKMRAQVACFGTYGYELDLNKLSDEEIEQVKEYTAWMKEYRELIQYGTFYRLISPFETENEEVSWMVVSEDKSEALVGYYRVLRHPNMNLRRVHLAGLDPEKIYHVDGKGDFYGDALMQAGLSVSQINLPYGAEVHDFESEIYHLKA